ncbi:MAG: 2,3-bisphosphoglycerate-independent phosphoglycerate mutase [Thermoplasmata archaeon]|nr:2,3-bisphosphoglycerate-independent phosphoglycerate mutase [Thermoplasmata archaeon]
MKKKILMLVCDGLGDRAVKQLGFKTPLQVAKKENFDFFASDGKCGLMDVIAPGIRPGSDTAQLSIFGYNPYEVYTGRGPFEAAGVGIDLKHGDVAFRCNFATVDENMNVVDRRAGRINKGTEELASALDGMEIDGVQIIFKDAVEHRAVLVLRGEDLSGGLSDIDPHGEGPALESKPLVKGAEKTASVLNRFVKKSHDILKDHEVNKERSVQCLPLANIVLPRGGGVVPKAKTFEELHDMKAACVAGVTLIKGICRAVGMDVLDVKGATGTLETDMLAKAKAALQALKDYDFVYVNVKAPDICGHDGLVQEKVKVIERIDKMLGYVKEHMPEDVCFVITADHSTPLTVGDHSGDPVPILIYGGDVRRDDVKHFDELSCAKGALGRIRGRELMPILMSITNRAHKFGS